ncbi:hypothetical protein STEG23_032179, partial [Scotinomys teguina]
KSLAGSHATEHAAKDDIELLIILSLPLEPCDYSALTEDRAQLDVVLAFHHWILGIELTSSGLTTHRPLSGCAIKQERRRKITNVADRHFKV